MIRSQEGSVVVVAPSSILSVVRMALGMETNDTGAEESSTVLPETQTAAVSEAFSEESDN
jgi:hypothetical protein